MDEPQTKPLVSVLGSAYDKPGHGELAHVAAGGAEAQDALPPSDPDELAHDLAELIVSAVDVAQALSKQKPSRELSLTVTKLEEAEMWYSRVAPTDNGGTP